MKQVELYTDGACSGNPGPGGWGAILLYGPYKKELSGYEPQTTNNRMELLAAVEGLSVLREPCQVCLYSDSSYLVNAFAQGWLDNWQRNNWLTSAKKPVKNQDLWKRMPGLLARHEVRFHWLKGHAGHAENERCDELARGEASRKNLPEDAGFEP